MTFEVDVDCTTSCCLVNHGNLLTKALTKRDISEENLMKFLVLNCGNWTKILDENGRSCLHICGSNSKPEVAEFLIRHGSNINLRDTETNWTPLHRAVNYACLDVAVLLKRYGASFDIFDSDYLTPLQLIYQSKHEKLDSIELQAVVWGRNKNYNLGIGNITTKESPDVLKGLPNVKKASINKFHSLFLSSNSKLWGCGHSKEGRLGIGNEATLTQPQEIKIKFNHKNETVIDISAGMFHSIVLTNKSVYATGSNRYYQLGTEGVESWLNFKEIALDRNEIDLKNMMNVIACDYHSLFVSKTGVFVCGLNVGQFNGIQESIVIPRRMPYPQLPSSNIIWTASNNACICIYLKDKNSHYLHIFCNRKMKTYKNPLNERLKECTVNGGELLYNSDEIVKNSSQKPLTVFILTEHNNLFIWYEDIMQFTKVHISPGFTVQITSITACNDDLLIHANQHLFKAAIQHKVPKMYQVDSEYKELKLKRDIAQFLCAKVTIKRISNLANVEKVYCDAEGESFIAILGQSVVKVEELEREFYDFTELLDDFLFASSGILDVKFIVKSQEFPANRFLVSSRCDYLKNLLRNGKSEIEDERLTPEMFQCILTWIYKQTLNDDDFKLIIGCSTDDEYKKIQSKIFHDILLDWKLYEILNSILHTPTFYKHLPKYDENFKVSTFNWFNMEDFPEFYDVTIQLEDNQKLRAHKVILMMRIEYFKMMFYHSWSEDSIVDLRHVSITYMRPIIQFAYDNNIDSLLNANFSDNFSYNMCCILDQYLIEDLKNIFEMIIIRKVNLKNCAENLDFSITYNCHKLRDYCMSFICLNLSRILESNILDILDVGILRDLSVFYRKFYDFDTKSNHIMTPAFDAPEDMEIEKLVEGFDLLAYCEAAEQAALKKTPKSKSRLSKSEMTKRNYEKVGMEKLRNENVEPTTPKSPDSSSNNKEEIEVIPLDADGSWQRKSRERKDSGKRKALTASKVNEIVKNEVVQSEQMVDLKSLRKSISEDVEEAPRNAITLADFYVKTNNRKKVPITSITKNVVDEVVVVEKPKLAWNMDNVELKPVNFQSSSAADLFSSSSTPPKRKSQSQSQPTSTLKQQQHPTSNGKNFNSIIRDERKEKTNYEKIKSKSLILTQIEEQAIIELSKFYNIDNIFDENITVERKVHKASQNLSQWSHHSNGA